jgi:HlyD family secretion protein
MRTQTMTMTTARALALLTASALALTACGKKDDDKAAPTSQARAVSVGQVETRPLGGGIEASGVLLARDEAVVGSELSGYRVARIYADEGDYVRAGQPLVQLDATLLRAQIDQQAAVAAQAQAEAARVSGLDGQGVLSQEQIESRRYTAKAQAASLNELKTRQSRMTIVAPVGGRVIERGVKPGEISGGGTTPWFRIVRDGLVELEADVNEQDLAGLAVGQPATVTLPGGQQVAGAIRLVSPRVNADTRLGKVRIRLPVREDLRAGGFGKATFGASGQAVTAVPETAIRYDASGLSVVTVDANNRAKQVAVRTGRRGGGWVELVQGPAAGTRVIIGSAAFAGDGDLVKPQPVTAAQKAAN